MPVFCGDGAGLPGSGFGQLSGVWVMPDFLEDACMFAAIGGTAVRALHTGQGISLPTNSSPHSRRWPQWEHLNLIWLIGCLFLMPGIIAGKGEIVQLVFSPNH